MAFIPPCVNLVLSPLTITKLFFLTLSSSAPSNTAEIPKFVLPLQNFCIQPWEVVVFGYIEVLYHVKYDSGQHTIVEYISSGLVFHSENLQEVCETFWVSGERF